MSVTSSRRDRDHEFESCGLPRAAHRWQNREPWGAVSAFKYERRVTLDRDFVSVRRNRLRFLRRQAVRLPSCCDAQIGRVWPFVDSWTAIRIRPHRESLPPVSCGPPVTATYLVRTPRIGLVDKDQQNSCASGRRSALRSNREVAPWLVTFWRKIRRSSPAISMTCPPRNCANERILP
jgi:hypothetical protein